MLCPGDKVYTDNDLDLAKEPFRMIISGSSNSGKSYLCAQLIEQYHSKFDRIVISGGNPESYKSLSNETINKAIFYEELVDPFSQVTSKGIKVLIVIDDLYNEAFNNIQISNCFSRGRHANLSIILITQNLFPRSSKYHRDITLNASHMILLRQRDLNQVEVLLRQIVGKESSKKCVQAYRKAVTSTSYGHFFIDLTSTTPPELQFRSNIFKTDYPYIITYQI